MGEFDDWNDDGPKKVKIFNDRYKKVKKLGEGSFNIVSLAEDLYPEGKRRMLSQEFLDLISQLPSSDLNPYRK